MHSMKSWPEVDKYEEAMQNPSTHLLDRQLKQCKRPRGALGFEQPYSGQFAAVFRVIDQSTSSEWAVRCFLHPPADCAQRYAQIAATLLRLKLPYMIHVEYVNSGIRVEGHEYPILKMPWVKGQTLIEFIEDSIRTPQVLLNLAAKWVDLIAALHSAGIAHGDLQHDNVMIVKDEIRLVDYDGMYVPALKGLKAEELGMENYQHPDRNQDDFGDHLDNFSSWVIYTSLYCLAHDTSLWDRCGRGNKKALLFTRDDYKDPASSQMLKYLLCHKNEEVKRLAELFHAVVLGGTRGAPRLESHLKALDQKYFQTFGFNSTSITQKELDRSYSLCRTLWREKQFASQPELAELARTKLSVIDDAYRILSGVARKGNANDTGKGAESETMRTTIELLDRKLRGQANNQIVLQYSHSADGTETINWGTDWMPAVAESDTSIKQYRKNCRTRTSFSGISSRNADGLGRFVRSLISWTVWWEIPAVAAGLALLVCYVAEPYTSRWTAQNVVNSLIVIPNGMVVVDDNNEPVKVEPFALSDHEVTQQEYELIMGVNPSIAWGRPDHPVENVSFDEATAFLKRVQLLTKCNSLRLPYTLEWSYAANRLGYTNGWTKPSSHGVAHSVRSSERNDFSVYDMVGNVSEWCLPKGTINGSNYQSPRPFVETQVDIKRKSGLLGFRLARSLSPQQAQMARRQENAVLLEVGDVYYLRNEKERARAFYDRVISADDVRCYSRYRELERALTFAQMNQGVGNFDAARALLIKIRDRLSELNFSPSEKLALKSSLANLLAADRHSINEALAECTELVTLLSNDNNTDSKAKMALYTILLGQLEYNENRPNAKEHLRQGIELAEALPKSPTVSARIAAAQTYLHAINKQESSFHAAAEVGHWRDYYDAGCAAVNLQTKVGHFQAAFELAEREQLWSELFLSTKALAECYREAGLEENAEELVLRARNDLERAGQLDLPAYRQLLTI